MKFSTLLGRTLTLLSLTAGAANIAIADTSTAAFYDPHANFLTAKLPSGQTPAEAAINQRKYFKKLVLDSGYVTAASTSNADIETAIGNFTLGNWKTKNGFGTATAANKAAAKYFNSADLGLGRDMNCVNQDGNTTIVPLRPKGMACYVSNHGKFGDSAEASLIKLNTAGDPEFATVAMEYRPDAAENKVRFFVFNSGGDAGKLAYTKTNTTDFTTIKLDNGAGQTQPGICLSCHGGTISTAGDTITGAHFLPFDTFSMEFASLTDRKNAQPAFNKMNMWIYSAELSANPYASSPSSQVQIIDYLKGSYLPAPSTAVNSVIASNAVMNDNYVDARFAPASSNPAAAKKAYENVIKPFCRGCHLALTVELKTEGVAAYACNPSGYMPHAEINARNLYRHHDYVQPIIKNLPLIKTGTNCNSVFKLTDFDGTYVKSARTVNTNLVSAPTTTALAALTAKTTIQARSGSFLPIHLDNFKQDLSTQKQKIKSISFAYFLPTATDNITNVLGGVGTIDQNSNFPIIPGTQFRLASAIPLPTETVFTTEFWLNHFSNSTQSIEVEDLLVEWSADNTAFEKRADFEDKTFGDFAPTISFAGTIDQNCTNQRNNDFNNNASSSQLITKNAFEISQRAKLNDDGGRYSLSTNKVLCVNEIAKIVLTLPGADATKTSVLSFNYATLGGTLGKGIAQLSYVDASGALVTRNLHELVRNNGLDSNLGAAGGYAEVNVPANASVTITYQATSGTSAAPNTGLTIDNITWANF